MTNMCFDVCTWRVKACVPGPLRESEFKEPHIWGFTAGFEGTVFCQAAEYPSSSMQAPRQQGIHAADRNTNECAALCFSGVPIDSHSSLGEVMKDTENGLFSVLQTTQTGPGLEAFLPRHCSCQTLLLEPSQNSARIPLPGLLPGHTASLSGPCVCIPTLALPESRPVICPRPYQHLSSCPIWKVGPVTVTSLKWEICSELLHD